MCTVKIPFLFSTFLPSLSLAILLLPPSAALATPPLSASVSAPKQLLTKTLRPEYGTEEAFNFSLGGTLSTLVSTPRYSNEIYDDLTLFNLRKIREDAAPVSDRADDLDTTKTRRGAGRALTIQTSRSLSTMLDQSDLRHTYRTIISKSKKSSVSRSLTMVRRYRSPVGNPVGKKFLNFRLKLIPAAALIPKFR